MNLREPIEVILDARATLWQLAYEQSEGRIETGALVLARAEYERWERALAKRLYPNDKSGPGRVRKQLRVAVGASSVRLPVETLRPYGILRALIDQLDRGDQRRADVAYYVSRSVQRHLPGDSLLVRRGFRAMADAIRRVREEGDDAGRDRLVRD
ncbi:MAG TPA: hypothetical protein VJN18_22875, partial [Polyangiaceae bacterium]|nr:hypothetical protein [Polyangiaceae bacterium]